jgi:HK97 family phage major capsid protein
MTLVQELKERRQALWSEAESILNSAETRVARHGGDLSSDEQDRLDHIYSSIDALDERISELDENRRREQDLAASRTEWANNIKPDIGARSMHEFRYGNWLAEEIRAITSGLANQSVAPSQFRKDFWDLLHADTVALRAGVGRIEVDKDQYRSPRLTADVGAAWTAEAATITQTSLTTDEVVTDLFKLAGLERASAELIEDAQPDMLESIGRSLVRKLGLALDLAFFEGSGSGQPTGLRLTSGIQTHAAGGALASLDAFAEGIGKLGEENAEANAIFVNAKTWRKIMLLKEAPTGSNKPLVQYEQGGPTTEPRRSIYGVPVFVTSQLPSNEGAGTNESSAYVVDTRHLYFVMRSDPRVEVSRDALFASDEVYVRGRLRAGVLVTQPKAVVRVTGILANA